jgi:hypothetical protein
MRLQFVVSKRVTAASSGGFAIVEGGDCPVKKTETNP